MNDLTLEEKQRLWKADTNPLRKIFLWGLDGQNNPCLLIMFGKQEFEREIRFSSRAYYPEAYLLKSVVEYKKYAIFHGLNGHLPSVPNIYYYEEENVLCHAAGYKSAHGYWDYSSDGYSWRVDIDPKYRINECYDFQQKVELNYYENYHYNDYVAYLKANNIQFQDFELIENPSALFGFEPDSPYMEIVIPMFSKERVYMRKKFLSQFIDMQPSVETYQRILKTASVEWACGLFQELTVRRDPILLEAAKEIEKSNHLWAKKEYHSGLKRCITQYISVFDEQLLQKQKEFIYRTLPEMDFRIKKLTLYNDRELEGEQLEQYLSKPYAYQSIYYAFGVQKLYQKNNYTDGINVYNIKFKNTIQTAIAYGMADAIGKIAYYLDTPRTSGYFKGSGRTGAYHYYLRCLRRTLDKYQAMDEKKFITAARELLLSYTDQDNLAYEGETYFAMNFFFNKYFRPVIVDESAAAQSIWNRYLEDVVLIAKHAKAMPVHEFCYVLLKRAFEQQAFDSTDFKVLIELSDIPYEKTASLFRQILLPKLRAQQEFDANLMICLMNASSEELWDAAQQYFKQTNGKFRPENIVDFLFMDTIDKWRDVLEDNMQCFSAEECVAFMRTLAAKREDFIERRTALPDQIAELLSQAVYKLESASFNDKQELFRVYASFVLQGRKLPDFLFDITETILFHMPYDQLKDLLKGMDLRHDRLTQRAHNAVSLLESVQTGALLKDSVILSVLETGAPSLVKMLTEITAQLRDALYNRTTTMLLLFECNVYHLNEIARSVFESMEPEAREKLHMTLIDSPVERAYQYGLKKLDDWYGNKTPKQFILRMTEHPCVPVKAYLSDKIKMAFANPNEADPDLYLYYVKTLLYLPNKASKNKDDIYQTFPAFIKRYPMKQKEIEAILLDIGSANSKNNSERALVAYARIQKEVGAL